MCASNNFYHLAKIPKFQHNYFKLTYQVPDVIRIHSRCNLESCFCSRGDCGMQPTALQENLMEPPWTVHSLWSKIIESVLFCGQVGSLLQLSIGYCVVTCHPWNHPEPDAAITATCIQYNCHGGYPWSRAMGNNAEIGPWGSTPSQNPSRYATESPKVCFHLCKWVLYYSMPLLVSHGSTSKLDKSSQAELLTSAEKYLNHILCKLSPCTAQ